VPVLLEKKFVVVAGIPAWLAMKEPPAMMAELVRVIKVVKGGESGEGGEGGNDGDMLLT
jgi:hypothetical protein